MKSPKHTRTSSGLFGNDDPEFLEALQNVDVSLHTPPQSQPQPLQKEASSSSSDLFGAEDTVFLDALSRAPLPDDRFIHSRGDNGSNEPLSNAIAININRLKRKRSSGVEVEQRPSPTRSSDHPTIKPVENVEDMPSYTDSDIYGVSKFEGFGEYMYRKRAKLGIQNEEIEESEGRKSTLFKGLALHINGRTNPSVQVLRKLIVQHGGIFHPYLDRKKMVTHVIASNLTPSKVLEFKTMKVVTPNWLLDSIEAGILLPWKNFVLDLASRLDESQGRAKNPQSSIAEIVTTQEETPYLPTVSNPTVVSKCEAIPLTTNATSSNVHPLFGTDPVSGEEAARIPGYAEHHSNPFVTRKMEDPQWRAENTAIAPGFIEGYYRNSRLHHLSTWKSELQDLVAKAVECVENGEMEGGLVPRTHGTSMTGIQFQKPISPRKGRGAIAGQRIIMHCDFDSFFVSAGLVNRPHLKGKPVVVCHSQGGQGSVASTSEIASSSYEARKFGIKNGMSLGQAKKLCPNVHTMPYEFEQYKQFSLQFYTILISYADDLQAVSVDEALIDVTGAVENARSLATSESPSKDLDYAKELAETIRTRVRIATGCEVSIGISQNILLARVATRRAKPAGSYHIFPEEISDILAPLDIADIRGFGWSTRSKLEAKFGVTTLGELAKRSKGALCDVLGKKTGETLWKAIRGIDDTKIESDRVRKSVSCEINYGIRFENNDEAEKFVRDVAAEVSSRLAKAGMSGRSLTMKVMSRDPTAPVEAPKFLGHGICQITNKTSSFAGPGGKATADATIIGECAWRILKGMHMDPKELRGIGIHVQKLETLSEVTKPPLVPGQPVIPFKRTADATNEGLSTPLKGNITRPLVVVDPPSQEAPTKDAEPLLDDDLNLKPNNTELFLPSVSQIDSSVLEALPADIRAEIEQHYARADSEQPIAGPSRHPNALPETEKKSTTTPIKGREPATDLARITRQLAPRSRPSVSPSKMMHPLFAKRAAPVAVKVSPAELKLLDVDPEVWVELPIEVQREQLAALRAANVGTGMAVRASMSTQAKQERILNHWRTRRRSLSVGVRGQGVEIIASHLELPGLKQRGKCKSDELMISDTEDVQGVIGRWVEGFEDGPRQGDVEYFGKFLTRCVETDVGAERGVSALKWWKILLRRRWREFEKEYGPNNRPLDAESQDAGRAWWLAFWEVKKRMDVVIKKRYGGSLSLT